MGQDSKEDARNFRLLTSSSSPSLTSLRYPTLPRPCQYDHQYHSNELYFNPIESLSPNHSPTAFQTSHSDVRRPPDSHLRLRPPRSHHHRGRGQPDPRCTKKLAERTTRRRIDRSSSTRQRPSSSLPPLRTSPFLCTECSAPPQVTQVRYSSLPSDL